MSKLNVFPSSLRQGIGKFLSKSIVFYHTVKWFYSPPTKGKYVEVSMLVPAEFNEGKFDEYVFNFTIDLITYAQKNNLSYLSNRVKGIQLDQINRFPGEHYCLLQAIMKISKPQMVVEVGTYTGLSALVLLNSMPESCKLITYDIKAWDKLSDTVFNNSDFGNSFEQRLGDLADKSFFESQLDVMTEADIFFIDGPKNGVFEQLFLKLFFQFRKKTCILVFDDIRLLHMIELWRSLNFKKIDLTSFGHWTGTGIVFFDPNF